VFVAGTGRSGTTWLAEMINYDNSFRILFEPFHSQKVDLVADWNYRQYLRVDNLDVKYLTPASAILRGQIRHEWVDMLNHRLVSWKRVIKDIRANLFLKWIKHNFPEIPIVLLLRHPCAVASSKLSLGWGTHLDDFLSQEELLADFLDPFTDYIRGAVDTFDKHIIMWCVENYVPLHQFCECEILVVFYEHLCIDPQSELERIHRFVGQRFSPAVVELSRRPSRLARRESAIISGRSTVESWRTGICDKQIARAQQICAIFGLDVIYGERSLPRLSGTEAPRAVQSTVERAQPARPGRWD
jgi:hypothetical protein